MNYVFSPHHSVSCLDSIFISTCEFVSPSISTSFLFHFLFHLITEFKLELRFMPGRTQFFSYLQSGWHPFSVLLQAHESLYHHIVKSNVKPCNRFEFSHISSLPATTASHFLHYLLIDQLYAKEVYFCSFVTKFNQASTNIHLRCFQQFL